MDMSLTRQIPIECSEALWLLAVSLRDLRSPAQSLAGLSCPGNAGYASGRSVLSTSPI